MGVGAHIEPALTPLAGGVSSEIYRVDLPRRVVCVKRALSRLKVAAEWHAPVERNRFEADWMRIAAGVVPEAVPALLGEDRPSGTLAMEWLPPQMFPPWKTLLREGVADAVTAAAVGRTLGRIHAATAGRADVAERFATDAIFEAIRIEPYLLATGRAHADLAGRFEAIAATTRGTARALVHGDFSPKNLLIGPAGPVILDAECAWYGDPAFDLAFVLNHLLLKSVWQPPFAPRYRAAFAALADAYLPHVAWEPSAELDARAAALLPALLLARIDGKSPVEYITDEVDRDRVRAFARARLAAPDATTRAVAAAWFAA